MTRKPKPTRDGRDAGLDEEIRAHLSMAVADRMARGETREQAETGARREFGNVGHIKEVTREMWGGLWLERRLQDVRFAWRSLMRAPGFSAVAVLTLALGIGANVAMFTVLNGVLFRPLPFRDSDRLVFASYAPPRTAFFRNPGMDEEHFLAYAKAARTVESMAAFNQRQSTLTGAGEATRIKGANVTAEFFTVLGIQPALGRAFATDDALPGHDAVIICDGLWRDRFGADPGIVGKAITLDGERRTVIAVMPKAFDFPAHAQLWVPVEIKVDSHQRLIRGVVARLAPGATHARALAELEAIVKPLERGFFFDPDVPMISEILPIKRAIVGDAQRSLLVFAGAVLFVLLIACANVANLLLMRASSRRHEIAIRTALGADRRRLIGQLLTESTLLAFVGGAFGMGLAVIGVRALVALTPSALLPRGEQIHIDGFVLLFAMGLCLLTGILFGLAPAMHTSRRNLASAIGATGRAITGPRGSLRGALVIGEIALALVLLTGAGLVARSFVRLRGVELGFQPDRVLALTTNLSPVKYGTPEAMHAFQEAAVERLAHLPGVAAAAAVNWRPLGAQLIKGTVKLGNGRALPETFTLSKPAVTPDYFRVMGIRVLEGRAFATQDRAGAPGVAIVSTSAAKQLWPGKSALGERIAMGDRPKANDWLTVVGVVDDIIQLGLKESRDAAVYQPLAQVTAPFFLSHINFVARTSGDPRAIAAGARDAIHSVDNDQPVESLGTMPALISGTIAEPLFQVRLLAVFSLCALVLAAIGIYGVLAYVVSERTREIGIRVAVGAVPRDVVRMMIGRTMTLTIPGVVVGALASLALTRVLAGFLFQVKPTDPATFAIVSAVLIVVAIAATIVPARRATRVDPLVALRQE